MKDLTLVILAGGMGSRFGGLKQIEPLGPSGEFIIDYSIYDAIRAGFNKVVFLIKEENYEIFKNTIGKRVEEYINVEYCFQKNDNVPVDIPIERVKPLGTAHAILCCKDVVDEPFMIINADDFYGRDAFLRGAKFLNNTSLNEYGLIGYKLENTIPENQSLKRGVCKLDGSKLTEIIESKVERKGNVTTAYPLDGSKPFYANNDDTVSMNMLLFTPSIFKYIEDNFKEYLKDKDLNTVEYLIPDVLMKAVAEKFATCDVIKTNSTWYGITYKDDVPKVKQALELLTLKGEYETPLFKTKTKKR